MTDDLRARRAQLASTAARLQWDLGGATYEMAIRDHFRLDVLQRLAAELQEVDAELGGLDRMIALGEGAAGGSCPACGALHARGAAYCASCGHELLPTQLLS